MHIPFLGRRRQPAPLDGAIALLLRLVTRAGEADGTRAATALTGAVASLNPPALLARFRWLVSDCGPPPAELLAAASAYVAVPDFASAARITQAAEPARQELLRRIHRIRRHRADRRLARNSISNCQRGLRGISFGNSWAGW